MNRPVMGIIPGQTIIVGTQSVPWSHPNRERILEAIRGERWDEIPELMSPRSAVIAFGKGKLVIDGQRVLYNGREVSGLLHQRILEMAGLRLPVEPLLAFLDRVEKNPSYRVREHLFEFLEFGQLPLTQDGYFVARKVVRGDFLDYHSGTVDWSPGKTVSMPREKVDDDPNHTCSSGLHVYNRDYGRGFMRPGGKFLAVKVDPAHVVSIPRDYNNTKMRVCEATVIKELTQEDDPEFFASLVYGCCDEPDGNDDFTDWADDGDEPRYCTECGAMVDDDDNYCPHCGESL